MTSQRDGFASALASAVILLQGGSAERCGRRPQYGCQIQVPIRDVKGQNTVGPQTRQGHRDELPRQQMHGDGIRAEGINDDHVEAVRVGAAERYPAIANHDVDLRRAHSQGT